MEVEQTHVIKFFVKEGMKGVEIIDRLNKHYDRAGVGMPSNERKCITGSRP
jgi:hypothetical protein